MNHQQNVGSPRSSIRDDNQEENSLLTKAPSQSTVQKVLSSKLKTLVDGAVFGLTFPFVITPGIINKENSDGCNMQNVGSGSNVEFYATLLFCLSAVSTATSVGGYFYFWYKGSTVQHTEPGRNRADSLEFNRRSTSYIGTPNTNNANANTFKNVTKIPAPNFDVGIDISLLDTSSDSGAD